MREWLLYFGTCDDLVLEAVSRPAGGRRPGIRCDEEEVAIVDPSSRRGDYLVVTAVSIHCSGGRGGRQAPRRFHHCGAGSQRFTASRWRSHRREEM